MIFQADVSDSQRTSKIAEEILTAWGTVDIVIANAGIGALNPAYGFSLSLDRRVMEVNYFGMLNSFVPFIAAMQRNPGSSLVAISSMAAFRGLPSAASYCASKAAQTRALESLRIDLRPYGINVLAIHPGFVATSMANHNEFEMPFVVPVRKAAINILKAIAKQRTRYYFPVAMSFFTRINRLLPAWLYDRLHTLIAQRQGHKKAMSIGFQRSPSITGK